MCKISVVHRQSCIPAFRQNWFLFGLGTKSEYFPNQHELDGLGNGDTMCCVCVVVMATRCVVCGRKGHTVCCVRVVGMETRCTRCEVQLETRCAVCAVVTKMIHIIKAN